MAAANVVVIGNFEDRPPLSQRTLGEHGPVAVFPGEVFPCGERHVESEVCTRRVFIACQQSVVEVAIEVVALVPRHLARLGELSQSEHHVSLVASRLLTLSAGGEVVRQRSVVGPVSVVADGAGILLRIVRIHRQRQAHLVHRCSPVAIGIRRKAVELVEHRQEGPSQHAFGGARVVLRPGRVFVAQQFAGIHKYKTLQTGAERTVVAVDGLQAVGIGANNLHGCCSMRLFARDDVTECVVVGSEEVVLARPFRPAMLPIAGDDVEGSGHLIGCRCLRVGNEFTVRPHCNGVFVLHPLARALNGLAAMQQTGMTECAGAEAGNGE